MEGSHVLKKIITGDIRRLLKKLNANKSVGPDGIHLSIAKPAAAVVCKHIWKSHGATLNQDACRIDFNFLSFFAIHLLYGTSSTPAHVRFY